MGKYYGIAPALEFKDCFNVINKTRPQDWWDDILNARIKRIEIA
jgi:hypothetical protein